MNKKGFTVIELLASFSIAMTILVVLFNVVIIIKDNLEEMHNKTELLVMKDNLSYNINERFKTKELIGISACNDGDTCYEFSYQDATSDKLIYDSTNKLISFNNYNFEIKDYMQISGISIKEAYDPSNSTLYNGYFVINIPIMIDSKDYSINIIKYFNTLNMTIQLT